MGSWQEDLQAIKEQLEADRLVGEIRVLKNAYGFIRHEPPGENRKDYFFHKSGLEDGLKFHELNEGDIVSFNVCSDGDKGLKCESVRLERQRHLKGAIRQ